MRKNRVIEQNRCCHLIRRRAHRAFFLKDEGQNRAVALMRRVEAGVQAGMSYCIDCKCPKKLIVYEGEDTGDTSFCTEEAMKCPLREESFYDGM